jgi:hypothetical protein
MSFPYTPSILQSQIWAPAIPQEWGTLTEKKEFDCLTATTRQIESKIQELKHVLERRADKVHQVGEMESLLHECHMARVEYIRDLSSERIRNERQARREEYKELVQLRNLSRNTEENEKMMELERKFFRTEQRRREKREEKNRLHEQKKEQRREKREQQRLEREAEIIRYTAEQRERIREQARHFRQMKRHQEEDAKQKEIADGWTIVVHQKRQKQPKYTDERRSK